MERAQGEKCSKLLAIARLCRRAAMSWSILLVWEREQENAALWLGGRGLGCCREWFGKVNFQPSHGAGVPSYQLTVAGRTAPPSPSCSFHIAKPGQLSSLLSGRASCSSAVSLMS